MEIICFTDCSYCPKYNIGVIVHKIYTSENCFFQTIINLDGVKNSELEKIGISECIKDCSIISTECKIIIYTDCESSLKETYPNNVEIKYIKGHSKKSDRDNIGLIFRDVDILARKTLRDRRRKEFTDAN